MLKEQWESKGLIQKKRTLEQEGQKSKSATVSSVAVLISDEAASPLRAATKATPSSRVHALEDTLEIMMIHMGRGGPHVTYPQSMKNLHLDVRIRSGAPSPTLLNPVAQGVRVLH